MSKVFLLIKTYLRQQYRLADSSKKGKTILVIVILALCMTPMVVMLFISFMGSGAMARQNNVVTEMLTFLILTTQMLVLILGIAHLLNVIYLSKDTERLLALPVKPNTIFISKLTYVYLQEAVSNLGISLIVLLPFGIGAGVAWWYYPQMLLVALIAPMLPLLLASIISIPLMWLVSFFKNKGLVTTIVYLLVFVLFMGGYYYFVFKINVGGEIGEDMISALFLRLSQYAKYIFPDFMLAKSLTAASFGEYALGLFSSLGINFALGALSMFISSAVYCKSVSKQLETPKDIIKIKEGKEYSKRGKVRALLSVDFKYMLRDTMAGFSMGMGIIMSPLLIVLMLFGMSQGGGEGFDLSQLIGEAGQTLMDIIGLGVAVGLMGFMSITANIVSTSSFSREGKNISLYKTLPMGSRDLLKSKMVFAFIFIGIQTATAVVACAFVFKMSLLASIATAVILMGVLYASSNVEMYTDLSKPRLNWSTFTEASKNSPAQLVGMGVGFAVMAVYGGIAIAMGIWYATARQDYIIYLCALAMLIITAIYVYITHYLLIKNYNKLFDRIGE